MSELIEVSRPAEQPRAEEKAPQRQPVELSARSLRLDAHDVDLGGVITLDELKLAAGSLSIAPGPGGALRIADLTGTLIVTESALNRFLRGRDEGPLRDLQIAMLTGKVRIAGRYVRLGIPVPFSFTAVPEIEGGARLRLDPRQMSVAGAPMPNFMPHLIAERINPRLAEALDVTRLPLPVRLTGLTVETGRILLHATAMVDLKLGTVR